MLFYYSIPCRSLIKNMIFCFIYANFTFSQKIPIFHASIGTSGEISGVALGVFLGEGKVGKNELFFNFNFREGQSMRKFLYLHVHFPHKITLYFRAQKSNLDSIMTAYDVNEHYRLRKTSIFAIKI